MITKTRFDSWRKGINKDTPRHQIRDDEAVDLNNVVHRSGDWVKRAGFTTPYTATGDAFNVIEICDYIGLDQSSTLLCGTKDSIYYLNGTTWVNRLNLGTARADTDKWFFTEGDGKSWACNGLDSVYQSTDPTATNYTAITWDTATVGSYTGTTVTRARIPLFMNNRLFLCDVTDGVDGSVPFRVRYSNPLDYDRTEGSIGFYDFDDTQTEIKAATILMNNAIVLFKEDVVGIIQNTGNPVLSPVLKFTPGIISSKAFTHLPNGAVWYISKYGFHMFANGLPEDIGRNKIREYFFEQLDESNRENIYCWTDWQNAEVHNLFPTGAGEPDKDLVYNWSTGAWSTWDFDAYCGFYRDREQTATNRYFGSSNGVVKLGGGVDDDGATITTTLESKAYCAQDLVNISRPADATSIRGVVNYIQANRAYTDARPTTTTVSFGRADYGSETPTYTNSATLTDQDGYQPVANINPTTTAYLSLKLSGFDNCSEVVVEWTEAGDL